MLVLTAKEAREEERTSEQRKVTMAPDYLPILSMSPLASGPPKIEKKPAIAPI